MTEYVLLSDLVALRREAAILPDTTKAYLKLYSGLHHLPVREIDDGLRGRVEALAEELERATAKYPELREGFLDDYSTWAAAKRLREVLSPRCSWNGDGAGPCMRLSNDLTHQPQNLDPPGRHNHPFVIEQMRRDRP